jgi:hypothetical protein
MKTLIKKIKLHLILLTAIFTIFIINGCNDSTITPQSDNLDFSTVSSSDSIGDAGILVIHSVKVLLKDIKLNVASSSEDTANFKVGPYVLYLDLSSSVNIISTGFIPAGTYDKVRFMVHKLEDNETAPDPDFVDANGRYSVVVRGSYAGVNFIYKSDKSAHQKLTFPGSLHVSLSGKSNITLIVKPYLWFIEAGIYLNPLDINNRSIIDNNIKENINHNFKICVDNDSNGIPD